ncbi:Fe-S cluster assembly protein SufD [Kaarinaea lacus]
MIGQIAPQEWLHNLLQSSNEELPGEALPWLKQTRETAKRSLVTTVLPHRKSEAWRYTNIDRLLKQHFQPLGAPQDIDVDAVNKWLLPHSESYRIAFVNGRCVPHLSNTSENPCDITMGSLRAALSLEPELVAKYLGHIATMPEDIFTHLNSAAINDGLFVHIPAQRKLDKPIEVIHLNTNADGAIAVQPRHLIVLEQGAEATVIERFISNTNSVYFHNNVYEIELDTNAQLTHHRIQEESRNSFHLSRLNLLQRATSRYQGDSLAFGANWSKTDIAAKLNEPGAECNLGGLYLVDDSRFTDFHLNVEHNAPHCSSREDFKGILAGKGRAVFDGRIYVAKDAQKTDAQLSNKNLLLSHDAEVDTKPQLEIFADDVKCSHGTTVGQLLPEQVFYLRSRGISESDAKKLLCLGFADEILNSLNITQLIEYSQQRVAELLYPSTSAESQ